MAGNKKSGLLKYKRPPPFIQQHEEWLASSAYRSLSCTARCLLQEFQRICMPGRNGRLSISVEHACKLLGVKSEHTARKAFRELGERGFLALAEDSRFIAGRAREYRLTIEECNGRAPTDDWRRWSPENPIVCIGKPKRRKQNDPAKYASDPRKICGPDDRNRA